MPKPISFLSDYGLTDEFVGVVHGVIARVDPDIKVIDITHGIPSGDIRSGALALLRAVQYVPPGVALAVVDPGVGTGRKAVAAETAWGVFIGPDNGLLAPAVAMVGGASKVVAVEDPRFLIPAEGATFDGRDRFAPAAAVLASDQATLDDLGPQLDPGSLTPLLLPLTEEVDRGMRGEVWWVDRFGNAQTNIAPAELEACGIRPGGAVSVKVGTVLHELAFVTAFGMVEPGAGMLYVDSYGLVAIAVRDGSAAADFNVTNGVQVVVRTAGPA